MSGCSCNKENNIENSCRAESRRPFFREYGKPLLSFLMLMGGIGMNWLGTGLFRNHSISLFWYLLAYLPVGLPVLAEGWKRIRRKDFFNEFTLMTIAAIGAFYIGDYAEGVAVMLFYSIGELFQERAVTNARRHIGALLAVKVKTATVVREHQLSMVEPAEVQVGEVIEVRAGERIPLDGILLSETATFNTAALTGESIPRTIGRDQEVLSGMIPSDKTIRIQVSRPYDQSTLARIIELIQHATERKAPAEMFITKFAHVYTPIVIGIAALVVFIPFVRSLLNPEFAFIFNDWLYRALVFLVISCPCALVISIPLGYFGGIGTASRQGILFKGGNYLDAITKINTVVFDKTGTLTKGTFDIQEIKPAASISETTLISYMASVEKNSTHPIAQAIVRYAEQQAIPLDPVQDVTEISGYGLKAICRNKEVRVGNIRLLSESRIDVPAELNAITDTLVVCAVGHTYIGYITLSDTLKEDAIRAIDDLKALQIKNIQLLSGDKQEIVTNFANRLGIRKAYGDLLPEEKVEQINRLKQDTDNRIAFIGDGMNDAPVLALSDVGIAMGGLGSDIAIETADVIIQTDQPAKVATAIRIGRYTRQVVWQNIFLAMSVKLLVMILGAGGLATLWEAVFADVGVALLAILNAMRISRMLK